MINNLIYLGNRNEIYIDNGLINGGLFIFYIEEKYMDKEKKRYIWLIPGISFWAGIGLMSILNIIKTVYNQHALSYDWIMLAVSIILIFIGLIFLIKLKKKK